jgi:predicted DNA-binding protein with PD1-like motif
MKSKLLDERDGLRTFAVIFEKGDEPVSGLERFAAAESVTGASLTAIGAFREVTLAYFDPEELAYQDIPVGQQVEVLSLVGDIALEGGEPAVHAHVVVGERDGSASGGHLRSATVWPTLEVIVTETPRHLHKTVDDRTGLALIDLDR